MSAGIPVKWSAYRRKPAVLLGRTCYEIRSDGPGVWWLECLWTGNESARYATHAEVQQLARWLDSSSQGRRS